MSKFLFLCILVLPLRVFSSQFIQVDEVALARIKSNLQSDKLSPRYRLAFDQLVLEGEKFLLIENPTVTQKTLLPPTKDKHDYLSISRYWWPNQKIKGGLPWYRRDGITNPSTQTDAVDRKRLGLMTEAVSALAYAYYFTGDDKYAKKTASIIRTWFLDEKTKMNPHLKFAQSVPGNPKGRRSGILDGRLIPALVLDSITLISSSGHWRPEDENLMNKWLKAYVHWLTMSKLGKAGAQQENNHGSWYFFQISALALYLDDKALLRDSIESVKRSLRSQMSESGAQIHELARTRSFFYSCFNLEALTGIAEISQKSGVSLWDHETTNGRSLALAIDFLIPAAKGAPWQYPSEGVEPRSLLRVLSRANRALPEKGYATVLLSIDEVKKEGEEILGMDQHRLLVELESNIADE